MDTLQLTGSPSTRHTGLFARVLWAGSALLVLATGGLLWAVHGERVFTDAVSAALSLCF